jgi:DNA polymerase-3 subunit epsilon
MTKLLREIAFDTETTGLKPNEGDRIIEIGAVEMINHIPTGKTFRTRAGLFLLTLCASPASRMNT